MNCSVKWFVYVWLLYLFGICSGEDFSLANVTNIRKRDTEIRCTLPSQPDHGRWEVVRGRGRPGEKIDLNTIVKFRCHSGYKLTTSSPYVVCDATWTIEQLPTCLKLCPPLYSTATTILKCTDIIGREVSCAEASHGTYLSYDCIAYYEAPLGYRKTLTCRDGQWSYNTPVCQPICGRKVSDAKTFAVGAQKLTKIEYPWIAAVYQKFNGNYTNICSGNIISRKVVLTAAHCVTNEYGNILSADDFKIGVGKLYNEYRDSRDNLGEYYEVRKLVPYPKYNGESRRFLGDIAIIVTKKLFKWGPVVQPVCISNIDSILLRVGAIGEIAGWGVKEDGLASDELRFLQIPYKNERVCASELPSEWEAKYNMEDKICAGFFMKNISVCRGDSGSGLVFRNPEDNRYYIHGVVSLGPTLHGECNIQQNSLYTKVAYYYTFIDRESNKYYEEQCVLPNYPTNGKYLVEGDEGKVPGDIVSTSSVLKITCRNRFTLVPAVSTVECENVAYMPKCALTCPTPSVQHTSFVECVNHEGDYVNCSQAVTGTVLKYTCLPGYQAVPGTNTVRSCRNGSWGTPNPGCHSAPTTTTTTTTTEKPIDSDGIKVICTYASWSSYKGINPDNFDAKMCTHVYYAFAGISETGDVRVNDDNLDVNQGLFRNVSHMKIRNERLKIILSIGGSKSTNNTLWSTLVGSAARIGSFIGSASYFIRTYNFDGINIDWHYPPVEDKENYIVLLKRLRDAFDKEGWIVSASARSDFEGTGYDVPKMNEIVHWVIVKTYDFYGHWSKNTGEHTALYPSSKEEHNWEKTHLNVDSVVKNWIEAGLSKSKLVISVAFYGRTFKLKDPNQHDLHAPVDGPGPGDGILEYSEICHKYKDWTGVWNEEQKSTYKYNKDEWFSYDTKDAIWIKGTYVKEQGLLGVNAWPVDSDDVFGKCGMKQELLKHLHGGLGHQVDWKS